MTLLHNLGVIALSFILEICPEHSKNYVDLYLLIDLDEEKCSVQEP